MAALHITTWRLISGTLTGVCLLLMATLGILLKTYPCRDKWIGYRCNCYFVSNEEKTWAESKDFCASQNSSLLYVNSKDEFVLFVPLLYHHCGITFMAAFIQSKIQSAFSTGTTLLPQKGSNRCTCQEKWIEYQSKCYFFSNEEKTWAESKNFCASQNSSLLQLKSKDEFIFKFFSDHLYWIGLFYDEALGAWLWEDGSPFSQDL
ncbi:natural killer cells antigen CD94-like [Rhynchocyon petersi]